MKKTCLTLALAGCLALSPDSRAQFAGSVISYTPGTGFAAGFTNASAAIGAPASGGSLSPFAPPFSTSQIVSLGAGGEMLPNSFTGRTISPRLRPGPQHFRQ